MSTLSPALLAARVMKPWLSFKGRQQVFIFGSPKAEFDQHAAGIEKFRLVGTLQTREQKKGF